MIVSYRIVKGQGSLAPVGTDLWRVQTPSPSKPQLSLGTDDDDDDDDDDDGVGCVAERGIEHHELICQVYNMWTPADEGRFYFRKDFAKYELFRNPTVSVVSSTDIPCCARPHLGIDKSCSRPGASMYFMKNILY